MLLWISGSLTPQQIRDRLKSGDKAFQEALINYLEDAHTGDFLTGSMDDIKANIYNDKMPETNENSVDTHDPTLCLPTMPPEICLSDSCTGCPKCQQTEAWLKSFQTEVDNIVLRSNVHSCRASSKANPNGDIQKNTPKGCLSADGSCAARFPRDVYEKTTIDQEDGHIDMKKTEQYINTYSPALTMLMRCNTDTTSLLSGTAVKAVISYVTDYVTKQALKTHQLFTTAYEVLQKQK
ncbi:hypothetical protein GALMADRAFT_50022, partial [Galerina marginata CBS 339.88]